MTINLDEDLLVWFDESSSSTPLKNSKSWFLRREKSNLIDYSENPSMNVTVFYSCTQNGSLMIQWSANYNEKYNITNFIEKSLKFAKEKYPQYKRFILMCDNCQSHQTT